MKKLIELWRRKRTSRIE